jgi:hypothetical protein
MIKPTKLEEQELKDLIDFQEKSEILIGRLGQLQFRKLQIEKEEEYYLLLNVSHPKKQEIAVEGA